jgi:uncharacterized protein (DUF4415 family)
MRKHSRTNWKRVDRLKDDEIDYSEVPQLGPDFFATAVRWPGKKTWITLRLDPDVLAFFRKHGKGYQTTINAVLSKIRRGSQAECWLVAVTSRDALRNSTENLIQNRARQRSMFARVDAQPIHRTEQNHFISD